MKKIFYPAMVCLLIACTNAADTEEAKDTTTAEVVEESKEVTEVEQVKIAFPQLFTFYQSKDSSFTEERFNVAMIDSMNLMPPQPLDESALKPYYPYLVYNQDSSKAIDLYSYNILLSEKNGKTVGEAGGPDTEIAVIDFKNRTRQRVFYAGPSFVIHDGKWVDNNTISLVGGDVVDGSRFSPFIWLIDVAAKKMKVLDYIDTLQIKPTTYHSRIPLR